MHHFLPLAIFFLWGLICRAATIDGIGDGSRSTLRATFADDFLVGAAIDYGELRDTSSVLHTLIREEFSALVCENSMKADDIERVTGRKASLQFAPKGAKALKQLPTDGVVFAGTLGQSKMIDQLVEQYAIDVSSIRGNWEAYVVTTAPGGCLLVIGSDRRGTAMANEYELLARRSMVRATRGDAQGALADGKRVEEMFGALNAWTDHYNNEILPEDGRGKWAGFFNWQPYHWFRSEKIEQPYATPEVIAQAQEMPSPRFLDVKAALTADGGVTIESDAEADVPLWIEALTPIRNFS